MRRAGLWAVTMAMWLGEMARGYERGASTMGRRQAVRASAAGRGGLMRLRGGDTALEDLPLVIDTFDDKQLQDMHMAGLMDNVWEKSVQETMSRGGGHTQYETLVDAEGLFDGFPSDWRRWRLKETHIGFLVPRDLQYSRSLHNDFKNNEMAVVSRNDGSKRFCMVVACDDDGALRNGEEVGKSYVLKLENDDKTRMGITRVERAENIGKIDAKTQEEEHVLDDMCRTEASIALKNMGNDALNMTQLAIAKYSKALLYIEDLVDEPTGANRSTAQIEFVKININLAFAYLKGQKFELCVGACERALKVDPNNTKALYRAGVAYRSLQKLDEAKHFFLVMFGLERIRSELRWCS
eukprot:757408-Hanusia_phi.AAC.5